jgi:hypothetical protein
LHKLLPSASLITIVASGIEQLKLLVLQVLASFVVLFDLHQNLLLLVLVGPHDPLNCLPFNLAVQIHLFLLKQQIVLPFLRGLSQLFLLGSASPLDPVLALTLSLHILSHHVPDVFLSLLGFEAFLLMLSLLFKFLLLHALLSRSLPC